MGRSRAVRVDFKGAFFTKDAEKTVAENIRDLMLAIAAGGEADIKSQLRAGEGGRAPLRLGTPGRRRQLRAARRGQGRLRSGARVSTFIRGRVQALAGKPWRKHLVISPDTTGMSKRDAISVMAAASSIEGRSHPFRRTARAIRVARKDMAKGLA